MSAPINMPEAVALLEEAAQQFRMYETLHRAKVAALKDPDAIRDTVRKADVNSILACRLELFVAEYRNSQVT